MLDVLAEDLPKWYLPFGSSDSVASGKDKAAWGLSPQCHKREWSSPQNTTPINSLYRPIVLLALVAQLYSKYGIDPTRRGTSGVRRGDGWQHCVADIREITLALVLIVIYLMTQLYTRSSDRSVSSDTCFLDEVNPNDASMHTSGSVVYSFMQCVRCKFNSEHSTVNLLSVYIRLL